MAAPKSGGSVANLKNEGNKGNNMPFQLRSLLLLGKIFGALDTPPATPSGENHIGSVGGETYMQTIVPVTSASVYNPGDVVGGLLTLTNAIRVAGKKGQLQSINIMDTDAQSPDLEILFFTVNPAAASTADAAPFAYNTSAMIGAQIAKVKIASADWSIIDNVGSVSIGGILETVGAFAGTTLYAVIVAGTTAPTLTGNNSLRVTIGILQD